jgi:hypothetical protein
MVVSKDVSKIAPGSKTLGPCQAFRIDSEGSESQSSFLELGLPSVYCFFGDRVEEWIEAQMREGGSNAIEKPERNLALPFHVRRQTIRKDNRLGRHKTKRDGRAGPGDGTSPSAKRGS